MSHAMSFQARVQGSNYADIQDAAVNAWQEFLGDPEAELPWSSEFVVLPVPADDVQRASLGLDDEGKYYAEVTVNWSKQQD